MKKLKAEELQLDEFMPVSGGGNTILLPILQSYLVVNTVPYGTFVHLSGGEFSDVDCWSQVVLDIIKTISEAVGKTAEERKQITKKILAYLNDPKISSTTEVVNE